MPENAPEQPQETPASEVESQTSQEPQPEELKVKERNPRMLAIGHLKHRLKDMGIYSVKTDRRKRADRLAVKPTTPVHKIG